jgi:hypothetical protein
LIEKFNFYDIYGYFLPGAVFLAVLWIPFGLVSNSWPSSNWSSAIIAAAFAYILGHLTQSIATNAIPSWEVKGPTGKNRYPSEMYLDPADKELPEPSKGKISELIEKQFGLKLQIDKVGDDAIDKVRNNAFLFARQILIQGKAVSYAEQFQGMYALTRGLVSVFALAFAYWLGWAAAVVRNRFVVSAAVFIIAGSLMALVSISVVLLRKISDPLKKRRVELGYAVVLLIAFLGIGYRLGIRNTGTRSQSVLLAFLAAWALIACLRAYGAYKFFARRFASTVWRDYLAYNVRAGSGPKLNAGKE